MKKGFTLIELLAVIIILAVIALIATPVVLNVIESSKKQANKNSVYGLIDGARLYYAESMLDENKANKLTGNTDLLNDIKVSGKKPEKGNIYINKKGEISLAVVYDKTCYKKDFNDNELTETNKLEDCKIELVYITYKIGDKVTLKDNSEWYVIEDSNGNNSEIKLFASKNIKHDAPATKGGNVEGYTTVEEEYIIKFDEANARTTANNSYCTSPNYGCNIYEAQSGIVVNNTHSATVTEDSTIKKFIDNKVKPYINNSLIANGGTAINSIRLITLDEIGNIINASDSNNNFLIQTAVLRYNGNKLLTEVYTNVPSWLYSTGYLTMTPDDTEISVARVSNESAIHYDHADFDRLYGLRPVIVTLKSNIKY